MRTLAHMLGHARTLLRGGSRAEHGFTLIEVIVVVSILSILASVVIPSVTGLVARGQATEKAADLRETTVAVARYVQGNDSLPITQATQPAEKVRDTDGDGVIRVAVDTSAVDGTGALPGTIEVSCVAASTSLTDAFEACFGSIDFFALGDLLANRPPHAAEDVTDADGATPVYDDDVSTPDLFIAAVNLAGDAVEVYVKDDGGVSGTAFPGGTVRVWSLDASGRPFALIEDDRY